LRPYQIFNAKADMVMTTHVSNRQLDPSGLPATLSQKMLQDLLRVQLNYQGLIVADDLQMKGLTTSFSLTEIVELAINAGNDILLFGNMLEYDADIASRVISIVMELIKIGKISEQRIDDSYQKILTLKNKLNIKTQQCSISPFSSI
jgi:beta-N-acetylhexosaminidase